MKYYIDLANILKDYNISLTRLAALTGMHKPCLSRIKKDKTISLKNLSRIATVLNETDANKLLSRKED